MISQPRHHSERLPGDLRAVVDVAADLVEWARALDDQLWPRPPVAVTLALIEKAADELQRVVWSWQERVDDAPADVERDQEQQP